MVIRRHPHLMEIGGPHIMSTIIIQQGLLGFVRLVATAMAAGWVGSPMSWSPDARWLSYTVAPEAGPSARQPGWLFGRHRVSRRIPRRRARGGSSRRANGLVDLSDLGEPAGGRGLGLDRGFGLAAVGAEVEPSRPFAGLRPFRPRCRSATGGSPRGPPGSGHPGWPGPEGDPAGRPRLRAGRRGSGARSPMSVRPGVRTASTWRCRGPDDPPRS